MSQYEMYQVVNVPQQLLLQQQQLQISDEEVLVLIKLLAYNTSEVDFVSATKKWGINRDALMRLSQRGLIVVSEKTGQIIVELSPLFIKLSEANNNNNNNSASNNAKQETVQTETLTSDRLDRISFLLNRRINNMELEKLKEWLNLGYTLAQIEVAIQKSTINQVDNFNYIEKVLLNSTERKETKSSKIQRNIDLY